MYGTPFSQEYFDAVVERSNTTPFGGSSELLDYRGILTQQWRSRSGENSLPVRITFDKVIPPLKRITRLRKIGRLNKAVYSEVVKRRSKNVYLLQERYVRGRTRTRMLKTYRKPNRLSYEQRVWSTAGDGIAEAVFPGGYKHSYSGSLWYPFPLYGGTISGVNPQDYEVPSGRFELETTRIDNELLAKFYDVAAEVELNIGQMLAERKQTLDLLKDGLFRLIGILRTLRKGDLRAAIFNLTRGSHRDGKQLADDFLAFQFGVKPLISDIQDAVNLVRETREVGFDFRRSKRYVLDPVEIVNSVSGGIRSVVTEHGWVQVKYHLVYRIQNPGLQLLQRFGFSPTSLAWELTPWSFVFDWVFSIGDAIVQMEGDHIIEPISVVRTVAVYRMVQIEKQFEGFDPDGYKWRGANSRVVLKQFKVNRDPLTEVPRIHPFTVKRPIEIASLHRALLSLALFRQKI